MLATHAASLIVCCSWVSVLSPSYVNCDTTECPDQFFWLTIAPTGFFIGHQVRHETDVLSCRIVTVLCSTATCMADSVLDPP